MTEVKNIILAWELYQKKVRISDIAKHCQKHRATISHWISRIKRLGLEGYLVEYRNSKSGQRVSRQLPLVLKERIWSIRAASPALSGYKIHKLLLDEGISISISKIYEVLRESSTPMM